MGYWRPRGRGEEGRKRGREWGEREGVGERECTVYIGDWRREGKEMGGVDEGRSVGDIKVRRRGKGR